MDTDIVIAILGLIGSIALLLHSLVLLFVTLTALRIVKTLRRDDDDGCGPWAGM